MANLMTQARLKLLLLTTDFYNEEAGVILAWSSIMSDYFSAASLSSNVAASPSYVIDQGATLKIGINSYVGAGDVSGSSITVICNITGASDVLISAFDTQNYIITNNLLRQEPGPPSIANPHYTIITTFTSAQLTVLRSIMAAQMVGIIADGAFTEKLANGIIAWWDELIANPGTYFTGATVVSAPTGVSIVDALKDSIQDALNTNNGIIIATDELSAEDAMDNIATELNDANTLVKGVATVGGNPFDIG